MLTSLLSAIQGAFASFTRGFLIVALVPVVLFIAANAVLLSAVNRTWYGALKIGTFSEGVFSFLWMVGAAAAALVLGALQSSLYRLTEGQTMPSILRWRWHAVQRDRLDRMRDEATAAQEFDDELNNNYRRWMGRLALPDEGGSVPSRRTRWLLWKLRIRRRYDWSLALGDMRRAVAAVHVHLAAAGAHPTPESLRKARLDLIRVIHYARDRAKYELPRIHNQLHASFPGEVFDPDASTDNVLAPTTFGNIGRTMRSYALRRYGMDLDIFWTRFQKVMSDSTSKMSDNLNGQKSQVDFLINMLWLTLLTGAVWTPVLWIEAGHPGLFVCVAIATPVLVWLFYNAACRAYLVFADQVRTAVDYFRFDVLSGLHIGAPNGSEDEEALWERLGNRIGYARRDATFLYVRKP